MSCLLFSSANSKLRYVRPEHASPEMQRRTQLGFLHQTNNRILSYSGDSSSNAVYACFRILLHMRIRESCQKYLCRNALFLLCLGRQMSSEYFWHCARLRDELETSRLSVDAQTLSAAEPGCASSAVVPVPANGRQAQKAVRTGAALHVMPSPGSKPSQYDKCVCCYSASVLTAAAGVLPGDVAAHRAKFAGAAGAGRLCCGS